MECRYEYHLKNSKSYICTKDGKQCFGDCSEHGFMPQGFFLAHKKDGLTVLVSLLQINDIEENAHGGGCTIEFSNGDSMVTRENFDEIFRSLNGY